MSTTRHATITTDQPLRQISFGLATAAVVAITLSVATHDPIADGPFPAYVRGLAVAAAAAIAVGALLAVQFGFRSMAPLIAGASVFACASGLHFWRLASPLIRGAPLIAFTSSFTEPSALGRQWDVETSGTGSASLTSGALQLTSVPRGAAYVRARLPEEPPSLDAWHMPVALTQLPRLEAVTWRAAMLRRESYLGVFQSKRLTIQAVSQGLLITYPDSRGDVTGHHVGSLFPADEQPHRWQIAADGATVDLSVDGIMLWSAPQREPLDELRLGETRAEPDHGGVIALYEASYTRRVTRAATKTAPPL